MLTAILVLQAFLLLFIIILSIVGWRKLTEDRQKLTEDQRQLTEQLKLTEQLTEDQRQLTEQLIVGWRKLTLDQQNLTEQLKLTEKLTEQLNEKRVSVLYEHITYRKNRLFKNEIVAGYRVQLLYDGVPIGDPTEKIVYSESKVDKEAVQEALTAALQTLQEAIKVSGTSLRVLNKVEDVIKTLFK